MLSQKYASRHLRVWCGPADPRLTAVGEGQAVTIREAWSVEKTAGIPLPEKLYCSPLNRALKTCELMFEGITPHDRKVLIIEVRILVVARQISP